MRTNNVQKSMAGHAHRRARLLTDRPLPPQHKQGLRKPDFISYGMRERNESEETEAMAQHMKAESMPARSRAWLEAECLTVAKRTQGGKDIQRVMIRRLN